MVETKRQPTLTGGCQCGGMRYALYAEPAADICHCRMCHPIQHEKRPRFPWVSAGRVRFPGGFAFDLAREARRPARP